MITPHIIQAVPDLCRKDAVGEEVHLIDALLKSWGFTTDIITLELDMRTPKFSEHTQILYHYSIGSRLPYYLMEWGWPILLRFHNITPAQFFESLDREEQTFNACQLGWQQMSMLVQKSKLILPVSFYNAEALIKAGAVNPHVVPLLRDYSRFENPPVTSNAVQRSHTPQFLFVGRLSPNKCQQDLLQILDLYKRFKDKTARLILVGGGFSSQYSEALKSYAQSLELKLGCDLENKESYDVIFAQNIDEATLIRLYHESTLFLCMSEHEGFCVPLVEAMHAGLPILAHEAAAVSETLGGAGILCDKNNLAEILHRIESLHSDFELGKQCIEKGKKRSQDFSLEKNSSQLHHWLGPISKA